MAPGSDRARDERETPVTVGPGRNAHRQRSVPCQSTVAIYRNTLLPISETFVLAQAQTLCRYRPVFVGLGRAPGLDLGGIPIESLSRDGSRPVRTRFKRGGLLGRQVGRHSPQLVHAHFGPDGLNSVSLAKHLSIPLVVTMHGYDVYQGKEGASAGHRRYLRRRIRLAESATRIVCVSDHMRLYLAELGFPEEKLQTHYIGVDTSGYEHVARVDREPVVLAVGRLVEKKGFEHLIHAMARLQAAGDPSRLVLIGDGPQRSGLTELAHRSLRSFEFLGAQSRREVAAWMRRAALLVVPSVTASNGDREGLPITLLEAFASGLPVVATRHSGIPEAVIDGESGLLVDERQVEPLAGAIGRLVTDHELWVSLSRGARRTVEERFDLQKQTRKLETIYDEVQQ